MFSNHTLVVHLKMNVAVVNGRLVVYQESFWAYQAVLLNRDSSCIVGCWPKP